MKHLLYVTSLLFLTALQPISKKDSPVAFKKSPSTIICGSCSPAYGLQAQKNYNQLQLNWHGYVLTYSYGGYYSYYDMYGVVQNGTFSGTTGGTQITITIPSTTFILTYRVTSNCSDGSTTASSPATFNF